MSDLTTLFQMCNYVVYLITDSNVNDGVVIAIWDDWKPVLLFNAIQSIFNVTVFDLNSTTFNWM